MQSVEIQPEFRRKISPQIASIFRVQEQAGQENSVTADGKQNGLLVTCFHVSSSTCSSTLKVEAICSSETRPRADKLVAICEPIV
jgi:hypothetical protein